MIETAPHAEKKSNFFLGFLLLSRPKRKALSAVYAYCRLIDDIADEPGTPKDEARRRLDFWWAEIERLYAGAPTHAVSGSRDEAIRRGDFALCDPGLPS